MKSRMNVIVAGGRDLDDYDLVKSKLNYYFSQYTNKDLIILSGGAKGTDALGERYAEENNIPYQIFKANWEEHGKKAGILRNIEMSKFASHLVAFWDGESKGTKHMIDQAKKVGIITRVVNY